MTATLAHRSSFAGDRDAPPVAAAAWFIAAIVLSATGIVVGLMWDISWHMTVGRDTFFTAPHVLEYVSGLTAGLSSGYVVLRTTFAGSDRDRGATVGFWGFRGPLGAWITIWGTFAMLVSAPFDDWWHNAYGLDVKIVSPPHMLLFSGMLGIVIGALVLSASAQNRSAGAAHEQRDAGLFAYAGGVLCFIFGSATLEYSWPNTQHAALYYQVWGAVFPVLLVGFSRAGRLRWGATASAIVFMAIWLVMGWTLRAVPAVPRLAPIWNPRTFLWPPYFPALLVVPAIGVDLLRRRLHGRQEWLLSLVLGAAFVLLLVVVQWPFANFMLSDASHNWFFNGGEWPYTARLTGFQQQFWASERVVRFGEQPLTSLGTGLLLAAVLAAISSRLGLAWGGWMARVQR